MARYSLTKVKVWRCNLGLMSEKRNRSGVCPLGDSLFNNSLQELEGELVADSELDDAVL